MKRTIYCLSRLILKTGSSKDEPPGDVYKVMKMYADEVDKAVLWKAFRATCEKRKTIFSEEEMKETLVQIEENVVMAQMWEQFRKKNYFVGDLEWEDVLSNVLQMIYKFTGENYEISN